MALTKVTGPLVSGSTNNLGDYTINNITGVAATFSGNLSVGGTITYQDVTSIDSVGIITAQAGIHLGIGATAGKIDVATGISTFTKVGIADSIFHVGNTDTSIRFPDDDVISVETSGDEKLRITSGKVGIGTANPGEELDIVSSTVSQGIRVWSKGDASTSTLSLRTGDSGNNYIDFGDNSDDNIGQIRYYHGDNSMRFVTNTDEQLRITSVGRVGIGTTNPTALLHLQGTGGNTSGLYFKNGPHDSVRQYFNNGNDNSDFVITYDGTGGAELTLHATGVLGLNEGNGDDVLIGAGSVIGDARLTIGKSAAGFTTAIALANSSGDGSKIISSKALVLGADYDNNTGADRSYLGFETNGTEKLRITSGGDVGIGTTNPTEKLDVLGNLVVAEEIAVNRARIVLSAPNDGTNYRHLFGANLQVNSSGTFTTPTANISGGGWEYLPANSLNAHGEIRYLSAPDTNATTSTPVERFRIDNNGYVGIGTDNPTQELTIHGSTFTSLLIKSDRTSTTDQIGGVSFMNQAVGVSTATMNALVDGTMLFKTAGSEALRIDSSGYVLAGHTTRDANLAHGTAGRMQLWGTSWANAGIALVNTQASTDPAFLTFAKSRKATASASATVVVDGDRLGEIRFAGDDGTDMHSYAASIAAYASGTIAGNRMPGKLVFATTNDAADAVSASTRMVLYSSGQIDLGTGVVNIAKFCQSGNNHQIIGQAADDVAALDVYSQHGNDGDRLSFAVSDNRTGSKSNAFVVRGDGRVGINATSPSTHLQIGDGTTDSDNVITLGKRVSSSESNLPLIGHHSDNGASSSLALCATSSSGKIHFFTGNGGNGFGANSNAERMLITSGGAVGIATDKFYDSSTRLEVRGRINTVGSASTGSINPGNGTVVNVGSLTNHDVQLMTGNSTRVTIVQAGTSGEAMRISGVGVTVKSSLTPNFEVRTTSGSGQDCKITLKGARTSSSTSSIAMIRFVNATSSSYTMGEIVGMDPAGAHASQIGDLVFRTTHNDTTTEVARFTGGATAAGRNLKFMDGSGIDFSATTNSPGANSDTTSEVLNDYERGTFDFKLEDANSGSDTLKMHYVKVGSIVHCYGPFRGSEGSNASVYWTLSGTGDSNITTSCELPFVPVDSGACDSPIYRNIETREPKNPSDGELMPVLGWAAGDSTCRLTDTRTEKAYNAYTGGDTMQKADTRTNVVLHFNFCYVTNS